MAGDTKAQKREKAARAAEENVGKSGTIKAITERLSPREFRVAALPATSEREQSQNYLQCHVRHMPAAGEIVVFDRNGYNRAGVERALGFPTEESEHHFKFVTENI